MPWEPRDVRNLYRWAAPFYGAFRVLWGLGTRGAERALDALFAQRIDASTRVLELAPGTGINIERLRRCAPGFASYLGIDFSQEMLEHAKRRAGDDARIELRLGDVTELSSVQSPFDFVVATWVLSHLESPHETVRSAIALLAPGGSAAFLFLTAPDRIWLRRAMSATANVFLDRYVDVDRIRALPHLERIERFAGGLATLAVFRRPHESDPL